MPQRHGIEISGARLALGHEPPVDVLGGVDLWAARGGITAIIGPSGCGKSTLLDAIAGLQRLDDGTAVADGDVALMPQRDALMPWLTLQENVAMGARLSGAPGDHAASRARRALLRLGLADFAHHYPHALSGGMRQRGALARTLLAGRSTWLLDEPFGALDALTRMEMHEVLLSLHRDERPTILLVTHDIAEAVALASRVIVSSPRPMRVVAEITVHPGARHEAGARALDALRAAGAMT